MLHRSKKRLVKNIKVDLAKCIGCRACEVICSGFHATPKYSSNNPARSRIRVIIDGRNDTYVPIRGGYYVQGACAGRNTYTIDNKEYSQCSFCNASCPTRDLFKEPDSDLPLKCDMCEGDPTLIEPMCVQVCRCDALTYIEREEDYAEEAVRSDSLELGIRTLANKHGLQKVMDALSRQAKQDKN